MNFHGPWQSRCFMAFSTPTRDHVMQRCTRTVASTLLTFLYLYYYVSLYIPNTWGSVRMKIISKHICFIKYPVPYTHTWNPNDLYFWRSTPQNKAQTPIKTGVIWVVGIYIYKYTFICWYQVYIKFHQIPRSKLTQVGDTERWGGSRPGDPRKGIHHVPDAQWGWYIYLHLPPKNYPVL